MSKNSTNKKNSLEIEAFFFTHETETASKMSAFIFDMLAMFACSDNQYTKEYKAECVMHFQMLNDLVTKLKMPESK